MGFMNMQIADSPIKVKHVVYTLIVLFMLILTKCSFYRVTIDAGEKGVIVSQPYFFGEGGVKKEVYTPDSYWLWNSNKMFGVSSYPQQAPEKFEDMMSADNIPVEFDAFLNYVIIDPVEYIKTWGGHWYDANVKQVFRNAVRDECKRHKMTDLISNPETSNEISIAALKAVQKFAAEKKMPFNFTHVTVGKINPNAEVMKEVSQTAMQEQRKRTEEKRKAAEESRKATEIARAAADNAYREAMNLAPEQYIRLEAVKAYSHAAEECAKNDKCTMILTQPGSDVKSTVGIK